MQFYTKKDVFFKKIIFFRKIIASLVILQNEKRTKLLQTHEIGGLALQKKKIRKK